MSKDMLNIDDFMRDRLGSHSEKDDPNAWLKMKALLDEEMPERAVPFYFRLRKPLAFVGAALLAGVLCVGGYRIHALRSGSGAPGGAAAPAVPVTGEPAAANRSEDVTAPGQPVPTHTEENKTDASSPMAAQPDTKRSDPMERSSGSLRSGTAHSRHQAPVTASREIKEEPVTPQKQSVEASASNANPDAALQTNIWKSSATHKNAVALHKDATSDKEQKSGKANEGAQRKRSSLVQSPAVSRTQAAAPLAANTGTAPMAVSPAPQDQATTEGTVKQVDSIKTILTVNKPTRTARNSRTVTYVTDTVGEQKVALQDLNPAKTETTEQTNHLIGALPAPNSQDQKEAAKENTKLNKHWSRKEAKRQKDLFNGSAPKDLQSAQLTATAVSSEKGAGAIVNSNRKSALSRFVENLRVEEKAAEAKRAVGNAERYFGFSVGGNYSLSSAADFRGIQFGPTGELVFNKHWSFFAALRYFNRSGSSRSVNDSYTEDVSSNVPDSTRGANYYFTIFTDSTTRRFNFSTVQSLEMPLSVRYSFKNFYVMTGLNLVYTLPVNVELYQQNEGTQRSHVIATNSTNKPIIENPGNTYDASSFKSRFGLGYIVGAGYRFAPAWHADCQLVNTFWDNSKGVGAKDVSKNFFKTPSVQVSIGFQFNRGVKKPTYGPTSTTR